MVLYRCGISQQHWNCAANQRKKKVIIIELNSVFDGIRFKLERVKFCNASSQQHLNALVFVEAQGVGGPTAEELLRMMEHWDCTCSLSSTPCISPSPSLLLHGVPHGGARLKASNLAFLLQASQSESAAVTDPLKVTKC